MNDSAVMAVTERIRERPLRSRQAYLDLIDRENETGIGRPRLACGFLAHGFAASATRD